MYLTVTSNLESIKFELNNMVKSPKRRFWKNREEILMKTQNKDMKRQIQYFKKELNKKITTDTKFDKYFNIVHQLKLLINLTRRQ